MTFNFYVKESGLQGQLSRHLGAHHNFTCGSFMFHSHKRCSYKIIKY